MKFYVIASCFLLATAQAAKEKKINLVDIERDNLASERKAKEESKTITSSSYIQQKPTFQKYQQQPPSPLEYGFRPLKTPQNYVQQPQYSPASQYSAPLSQYSTQRQQELVQSYAAQQQPQSYATQQSSQTYAAQQQPQTYATQQQYYTIQPSAAVQQYLTKQQQYVEQPQYQQGYQQYENLPLVADNSISQQQPSAYYTQQYVYLQPYTAASTSVQSVVDPKGAVQYVMYIPTPTYVTSAGTKDVPQEYVNVIPQSSYPAHPAQVYENADAQQYVQYVTEQETPQEQVKYVTEPQEKVKYVSAPQEVSTPQRYFSPKKEPKSLLDSYVPSYLQVQYYKQQQQALANSIVNPAKASTAGASGKSQQQTKKTYATGGSQSSSASSLTYNYQLPAAYYAIPGARK